MLRQQANESGKCVKLYFGVHMLMLKHDGDTREY